MVSHLQDSNIQQQRCETPNHPRHKTTRVNAVSRRLAKLVWNKSFTITLVCVCVCVCDNINTCACLQDCFNFYAIATGKKVCRKIKQEILYKEFKQSTCVCVCVCHKTLLIVNGQSFQLSSVNSCRTHIHVVLAPPKLQLSLYPYS